MKSKAIICAVAAATLGFASLSFAQGYERPGQGMQQQRGDQRGPDRDGRPNDPRGFNPHDNRNDNRNGPGYGNRGDDIRDARSDRQYGARGAQFHRGGRIPYEYRNRQYVVNNWQPHHLSAPPRGHQWVQVGSDYVLIAVATGIIAQLVLSQ